MNKMISRDHNAGCMQNNKRVKKGLQVYKCAINIKKKKNITKIPGTLCK